MFVDAIPLQTISILKSQHREQKHTARATTPTACSPVDSDPFGFTCLYIVRRLNEDWTRQAIPDLDRWLIGFERKCLIAIGASGNITGRLKEEEERR